MIFFLSRILIVIIFCQYILYIISTYKKKGKKNVITTPQSYIPTAQKTKDSNLGFVALLNSLREFPKVDDITSP